MKVICINEDWRSDGMPYDFETPVFGSEYTVINCQYYKSNEYYSKYLRRNVVEEPGIYYTLREFKTHMFHAANFAILPDKSADEMSEDVREGIVNLEKAVV